ncbi:AEC family transporter [Hahella sp. SMD15-11]|uniref:AEC family transporter n=1 Tax=Thermohahella caldifontis TaxID=3142973 RepID=A0AB39UTB2_9GAMM
MWDALVFAFDAIAPIFLVVLLGVVFRQRGWIDHQFVQQGSRLVFNVALPTLIFLSLSTLDLNQVLDPRQVIVALTGVLLGFLALWWFSRIHVPRADQRGVWVQGAFRGNLGIVGIALCAQVYGATNLAMASLLLGVITLLYNVLSVWVLQRARQQTSSGWHPLVTSMLRNPLILSILASLPFAWWHLSLPGWIHTAAGYFARMTLPLALICVGASLSPDVLRRAGKLALTASLAKLVLLPAAQLALAMAAGVSGMALGTLFLMLGSPTATASFIMVRAMGGDDELAAAIIVISTLASFVTLATGLTCLRVLGLI